MFSFLSRTSTSKSQPPPPEPASVTTVPQELDEKIVYQTADHNPTKVKEPCTDIKIDEMSGSRQNLSAPAVAKTASQGSRRGTGDTNEQPTVEGFYALKERLGESQKKLGNAESRVSKLQVENKKLGEKIAEMDRTFRQNPGAGYDKQGIAAFKELETSNRQKDEKIKELEKQVLMAQRLLEIKAIELSKAQAYTTKPDDFPGSEIIDMVKLLNSEIFNTATAISDMFEESAKTDREEVLAKRDFLNEYREMAKKCIGERLYTHNCQIDESMALRQPVNPKDWIPLQLALQCVLVGWCLDVAGTIGPVPGDGEALQRCYEKIRVREEQSVSARWRVIAAGATKNTEGGGIDIAVSRVMAVLCISGLSSEKPDYRRAKETLRKRMHSLEKPLLKLKFSMHEGIVSGDMELINVGFGEAYNPSSMIDVHMEEKDRVPSSGSVLCTVGLGVRKLVMKGGDDIRYEPLSSPEVALVDVLKDSATPRDRDYVETAYGYVDMVKLLNSEVFKLAITIKNLFEGSKKANYNETFDNWEFFEACSDMAKECIGDHLHLYNCQIETSMHLRAQAVNPKNWIPLQLALQCILVEWCSYVIGVSGPVPGSEGALQRWNERKRVREERSAFARWRAIIAGTTKKTECTSIDIAVTGLMAVLCISGLSSIGPDYGNVERGVREGMEKMEKLIQTLKTSMDEGIASGDMELMTVRPGKVYNPSSMVDAHIEKVRPSLPPRRSVLCTVGIGLRQGIMKGGKDVGYEPPEVALVDLLENFMTPKDPGYDS